MGGTGGDRIFRQRFNWGKGGKLLNNFVLCHKRAVSDVFDREGGCKQPGMYDLLPPHHKKGLIAGGEKKKKDSYSSIN